MSQARRQRGGAARRSGRRAEVWAALVLLLRGYRILGFRLRTRQGEIDLLALKGCTLRLDLMVVSPGRWPRHIPDAWPGGY